MTNRVHQQSGKESVCCLIPRLRVQRSGAGLGWTAGKVSIMKLSWGWRTGEGALPLAAGVCGVVTPSGESLQWKN